MSFYIVSNKLTASIVNAKAVSVDTNTRSFSVAEAMTDSTTYDLVASKTFNGTGNVVVDTALMATPYGYKGFATVHGIAISVVSGSVEFVQPASTNSLTGAPSLAASSILGPGMYYLSASPATVSASARNIEFNATAANFTVVVFGVEGVTQSVPMDADAQAYVDELDTLAGTSLEIPVQIAISNLVTGLKADGLWANIENCYLLCGPKTMSGARLSLKAPTVSGDSLADATANLFNDSNLDRVNGVAISTGVSQVLNIPDTAGSVMTTSAAHLATYVTDAGTQGFFPWSNDGSSSSYFMSSWSGTTSASFRLGSASTFADTALTTAQLLGAARQSTTALETITGSGTTNSHSDTATSLPVLFPSVVGAEGGQGSLTQSDARIAFASYGGYLDLAALRSRVNSYVAAISASGIS